MRIKSIIRKTPLLPRSSYLTQEIPPFRNSALNVEKGAGKSRSSAERNSAESDSGERDESLSEVQTLKRSKSKRELAEEVVFLRNNLRKSQVSLIGRFQRLLSINGSEMVRLKLFPKKSILKTSALVLSL